MWEMVAFVRNTCFLNLIWETVNSCELCVCVCVCVCVCCHAVDHAFCVCLHLCVWIRILALVRVVHVYRQLHTFLCVSVCVFVSVTTNCKPSVKAFTALINLVITWIPLCQRAHHNCASSLMWYSLCCKCSRSSEYCHNLAFHATQYAFSTEESE